MEWAQSCSLSFCVHCIFSDLDLKTKSMKNNKYEIYKTGDETLPNTVQAWNMYGKGVENIGENGKPETFPLPSPADDQLLVRVDSVGMCFSDVKLIRQGSSHPKLYNRDLRQEPTRLGHEVAITIIKVGSDLADRYQKGQRLAVQPDIYQNGKSTAYGYTVPGGLIQYHLIGAEVLTTDAGACLLPLETAESGIGMGYAETALLEPWGCVMAAYTQRRRLEPLADGIMWIIGDKEDSETYSFSKFLDRPKTIVLTDAPESLKSLAQATGAEIIERNGLKMGDYAALKQELTAGSGFDDIVVTSPSHADTIAETARQAARRGTVNLVGKKPLTGLVDSDVGRLHYDYIAFVGNSGNEITDSYGEARNRCELRQGGTAVFVGAGGPMGQMHVQRAIELPDGPQTIIATEVNQNRLDAIQESFGPLAKANGRRLLTFNPKDDDQTLEAFVAEVTDGAGADDVVISVPFAALMEEGDRLMKEDGMLVLFAGVPNGTEAPLKLENVYLSNAQYTGTSGLNLSDQAAVMHRTLDGSLSPGRSVAAIGGMNAALDGIEAMMDGRFPGKIVIFPQIENLPLTGLDQLANSHPDIAAAMSEDGSWTNAAEQLLIEKLWEPG
ncbi:MAG: threonine dehydrogenase-like Zn-dependent dehydrogenase [Cellvibrionaceae bacterium]|jgi:threonine dehydrogenase-like Zn-dependent dehydrogenase